MSFWRAGCTRIHYRILTSGKLRHTATLQFTAERDGCGCQLPIRGARREPALTRRQLHVTFPCIGRNPHLRNCAKLVGRRDPTRLV